MINLHAIPREKAKEIDWARYVNINIPLNNVLDNVQRFNVAIQQTQTDVAELEQRMTELLRERARQTARRREQLRFIGDRFQEAPIQLEEEAVGWGEWETQRLNRRIPAQPRYEIVENADGTVRSRRIG